MRQGYCYTCLAIGGGGYFGRVTKALPLAYPKNLGRLFFGDSLTRLKITSEIDNNLKAYFECTEATEKITASTFFSVINLSEPIFGKGCDEALFSEKKRGFQ